MSNTAPSPPAPASRLLRRHAYIDGGWAAGQDDATFAVQDPATGQTIADVARLGERDATDAVDAAQGALPGWRALAAGDRGRLVRRWGEAMLEHRDALAALVTLEQGKPLAEAEAEVGYAASFLAWFADEAPRAYGQLVPSPHADRRIVVMRQPAGVAVAITPWNFPLAMVTRKAGAALAAGCTLVLKPAEQTPLSALALAALAHDAGIPAGVLNVVTTDREHAASVGEALVAHPAVRKLSFTGSTAVGQLLGERCAARVLNASFELGGNAPFVVFADADLDAAVDGAIAAKFRNAGQTCICPNRLLVQDEIHDAFVDRLVRAVRRLKVGPGFDAGVDVGPLIDEGALRKVERHVADALDHGARLHVGGARHELGDRFYAPTVLTGVTGAMVMTREETFGPVASVGRFAGEPEAVHLANDTPSGLAGYVYTSDAARSWRMAEQLECGIVGVNTGAVSTPVAPFGGMKESGIGREGGAHGIDEWLETKSVCFAGLGPA